MITREDIRDAFLKCGINLGHSYSNEEYFDNNIGQELDWWYGIGVYGMTATEANDIHSMVIDYLKQLKQ